MIGYSAKDTIEYKEYLEWLSTKRYIGDDPMYWDMINKAEKAIEIKLVAR